MSGTLILLGFFLFFWWIQMVFWGRYLRIPQSTVDDFARGTPSVPVTVIVCFRDEVASLRDCVMGILAQDHPHFELLLVDDNSTDGSAKSIEDLMDDGRVRLLRPGPTRPGKKDALSFGIGTAAHECLVLTDADCVPGSPTWLRRMSAPLADHALCIGLSPYRPFPAWLSHWQRFEATYTALQYAGFAAVGYAYMGVGRNLAYTKTFFRERGGFASHAHLAGGDDDLLVGVRQYCGRGGGVAVVTDPQAWTLTSGPTDWRSYLRQKWRHHSVGVAYRTGVQALLGGLALSHGMVWLLGLALVFTPWWWLAGGLLTARTLLVTYRFCQPLAYRFAGGPSLFALPVFDFLLCIYFLVMAIGQLAYRGKW